MDLTGLGSIADLASGIIDKIWPDPTKAAEAKAALLQAQQAGAFKAMDQDFQLALEQVKANAAEAAQPGFHFRDGAGWVCVIAFASNFILRPLVTWGSSLAGHPVDLPQLDVSQLTPMLLGLLGLGGMHMYEQVKK